MNALAGPQYAKEEKDLRAELIMRRAAVDVVKKTIAPRYVDHGEDHRGDERRATSMPKRWCQRLLNGEFFLENMGSE